MKELLASLERLAAPPAALWRLPGCIAYVAAHSYPYSSGGDAARTHGVAAALVRHGHSVVVMDLSGGPWSQADYDGRTLPHDIDGVRYLQLCEPGSADGSPPACLAAAEALKTALRVFKPCVVMAASAWENALPAALAAHELGLPFFYELRGFAEVARASAEPAWHGSAGFKRGMDMETAIAKAAARVFASDALLRGELDRRGVDAAKIELLPDEAGPDKAEVVAPIVQAFKRLAAPANAPAKADGPHDPCPRLRRVDGRRLRVAAVMDEFTFHSYDPECELLQLHPGNWRGQLESFQPDLLFIESAWKGLDDLWQTKISNAAPELLAAVTWCKARRVPSLFWNKEDPVHFATFVPVAQQVDYVFTTDIDCIPKYKRQLGHGRVYLLPFAAQPKTHNPIELYERKDALNFAGSYYLRYPERQRDFAALIEAMQAFKPVDIYDRNYGNAHPHYAFPERYAPMILGRLPFEEISRAYKGYRYGINMNTIKQSQTMFARRVFELMASNTLVVSNFSRGVRLLFGDLVVCSDDSAQLARRFGTICADEASYRKWRLLGLRKVMAEHTYGHRLAYIRAKLSGVAYAAPPLPQIAILAVARDAVEQARLLAQFERQRYPRKRLCLLASGAFEPAAVAPGGEVAVFTDPALCLEALAAEAEWLGLFSAADHYGPHYLGDLALAASYSDAEAFGKAAYYEIQGEGCGLVGDGRQYRPAAALAARAALARAASVSAEALAGWLQQGDAATVALADMLAIDEFNYCRGGGAADPAMLRHITGDMPCAEQGVSFAGDLAAAAEAMEGGAVVLGADGGGLPQFDAAQLAALLPKTAAAGRVALALEGGVLRLGSRLPAEEHAYLYTRKAFPRAEMNLLLNSAFRLECQADCDFKTVFEFQDAQGQKIAHGMSPAGGENLLAIPEHCENIRFGLRVQGTGEASIRRLILGSRGQRPAAIVGRSPCLVLTKQYPAYDDLYRYAFLHSRLRAYKANALPVEVFRIASAAEAGQTYREFEGIDVATGDAQLLEDTLSGGRFRQVLAHLLDENMWNVLRRHIDTVHVTVWVHGAEIQLWPRRAFEFAGMKAEEVARQKKLSDKRAALWRSILQTPHPNLRLVFVSEYLKNEAATDLGLQMPDSQVEVISNYIDSDIFQYRQKRAEDRLRILSIRPYAKRVYANDLTAAAIVELSARPFFKELSFTLVGDGELFEDTVAPLRAFANVTIERRFLNHPQIAEYHGLHGVLLVPSRMDTQGVSRDEAMASGLVPVTTQVAAIPEFVDRHCGLVVPPEDPKALADAIEYLYKNPDDFLRLSKAAAQRVRRQCGFEQTVRREIDLIGGG